MNFALTAVSSNAKTGPIPVSTSSRATCPSTCPFYDKGCYAKAGPQALHWRKVTEGARGVSFQEFTSAIRKLQRGQIWRHNVSGDLPHILGNIDALMVQSLAEANRGRLGYTYTHHILNDHNIQVIREANAKGFTISASTENIEVADAVMSEHGIPAVAVVKSDKTDRFYKTESGRKVITCPAALHPGKVTCATCKLCTIADRDYIIAFPAHGNAKKTVNEIVA
jgi:hypothetical protein